MAINSGNQRFWRSRAFGNSYSWPGFEPDDARHDRLAGDADHANIEGAETTMSGRSAPRKSAER
jgi:hypothetical protein